jgi:hypothetical protein
VTIQIGIDLKPMKKEKEGKMTLKHRKNIVRQAKQLIKINVKNYDSLPEGKKEVILDKYIGQVCTEQGWTFSHFYCENGKILEKILNP